MANKVTKETLKMLIEEVLDEAGKRKKKSVASENLDHKFQSTNDLRQALEGTIDIDGRDDRDIIKKITDEDLTLERIKELFTTKAGSTTQLANAKPNKILMSVVLSPTIWNKMSETEKDTFKGDFLTDENYGLLNSVPMFQTNHKNLYQSMSRRLKPAAVPVTQVVKDDPSLTSQTIQTGMVDQGGLTEEQKSLFDNFFQLNQANDLASRIKAITNFSKMLLSETTMIESFKKDATKRNLDVATLSRKFIVNATILDIFNNFAKNIDHGAGAYFFESFMALLSGGKSAGKQSGVAGGMGETDFIKADGSKGSAKYLQKGHSITQAWKNFTPEVPVEYIVAYKEDSAMNATSDIEALHKIKIYRFTVEKTFDISKVKIDNVEMNLNDYLKEGTLHLEAFLRDEKYLVGDFVMPQTSDKKLEEFMDDAAALVDATVAETFDHYSNLMEKLRDMKTSTIKFSSTGNEADAIEAIGLSNQFEATMGVFKTSLNQRTPTTESKKITPNHLKKIIEESFKKNK